MTDEDWNKHYTRCLGMRLEGQMEDEIDERGRHIAGDTLLILFNSHNGAIPFCIPPHARTRILATAARHCHFDAHEAGSSGRTLSASSAFDGRVEIDAAATWIVSSPVTQADITRSRRYFGPPVVDSIQERSSFVNDLEISEFGCTDFVEFRGIGGEIEELNRTTTEIENQLPASFSNRCRWFVPRAVIMWVVPGNRSLI